MSARFLVAAFGCFTCFAGQAAVLAQPAPQVDADKLAYKNITSDENLRQKESPMLAIRVERGELPRLEERLPATPLVVEPVDRPGLYGGTWRKFETTGEFLSVRLLNNYYPLTRWTPDSSGIAPGLAESWSFSDDGTEIRFKLRKGLRWSDGVPMTSADIAFWWSLCVDERCDVAGPEWCYTAGERVDVSALDETTVAFKYAKPFYFLPYIMATGFWTPESMLLPAHYLRKFHPDHSDEDDFAELIRKANAFNNPDRPTMGPWMLTYFSATADRAIYERNPYYYMVDSDGRQLPYIDRLEVIRVQDPEAGVLYTISGSVDLQFRQYDLRDAALLKRFSRKGGLPPSDLGRGNRCLACWIHQSLSE